MRANITTVNNKWNTYSTIYMTMSYLVFMSMGNIQYIETEFVLYLRNVRHVQNRKLSSYVFRCCQWWQFSQDDISFQLITHKYPVLLCFTHMLSIVSLVPWANARLLQRKRSNPEGYTWWRHHMEIFSALLTICAGHSPVTGEFPAQRLVKRSFDMRLNKWLSKRWWGW